VARLKAPRGTFDVLPEDARRRRALGRLCEDVFERAGYAPMDTPAFEDTELFARGVGASTDIVQKEMFTFEDQGGRSLTLRPEGTAPICRAYVEHGLHKLPQPFRCWYSGPFFRHERPQTGRFRQFTQVGAEALGSDDPSLDAELILLLRELLERAGAQAVRLRLGSLGSPETRRAYGDELRAYLRARADELSNDVRARLEANPMRAFDSDHPGTRRVTASAPKLLDRLAPADREHFDAVRALLDDAGAAYEVDPALVRGLDYYTRTVFEFTSDALGAQSGVGGGGRYDRLVEELGGPPTPGVGWAAGIERILLAAGGEPAEPPAPVFVALDAGGSARDAFKLVRALRAEGLRAEMEQAGRSLKGQLRHASRLRAPWVVIVGEGEARVRDMRGGGSERAVAGASEAVRVVVGENGTSR
jgi:histidyl-tRNA synthetase